MVSDPKCMHGAVGCPLCTMDGPEADPIDLSTYSGAALLGCMLLFDRHDEPEYFAAMLAPPFDPVHAAMYAGLVVIRACIQVRTPTGDRVHTALQAILEQVGEREWLIIERALYTSAGLKELASLPFSCNEAMADALLSLHEAGPWHWREHRDVE